MREPQKSSMRYIPIAANDLKLARLDGKLEVLGYGGENVYGTG